MLRRRVAVAGLGRLVGLRWRDVRRLLMMRILRIRLSVVGVVRIRLRCVRRLVILLRRLIRLLVAGIRLRAGRWRDGLGRRRRLSVRVVLLLLRRRVELLRWPAVVRCAVLRRRCPGLMSRRRGGLIRARRPLVRRA